MKDKKKDCTVKLLNNVKHPFQPNMLWIFSDGKNFCQDQIVNSHNNQWLSVPTRCFKSEKKLNTQSGGKQKQISKTKHPVFGVVTSNGDVIPPFIFPYSLRLNMEPYIKFQEEVMWPWIKRVTIKRPISDKMPHK